jgi:hypothetical protein
MPQELRKLQLYGLEDIRLQKRIKGLADQSQGKYIILIGAAHANIEDEDRFEEFTGQGIHGERVGGLRTCRDGAGGGMYKYE